MAELKTIIQLRNDTTENWLSDAGKATELRPGEVAVEITEDGKTKLKIGTKDKNTFEKADYFGEPVVYQSNNIDADSSLTDLEVIEILVGDAELHNGDCAIIKRKATAQENSKILYTSYVYDDSYDVKWLAMDGNYSSNNVIFQDDIVLAGSYQTVGNINKGSSTATSVLSTKGMSLTDVMQSIFTKEEKDNLQKSEQGPSASITSFTEYIEIGSSTTKNATVSLSADGEYVYGYSLDPIAPNEGETVSSVKNDKTTGVVVDTNKEKPYSVVFNGVTTESSSSTFSIETPVKTEKTELAAYGKVYHTEGGVPVSNLKKAYPAQKIAANQVTSASSAVFRWYIPYYTGFIYGFNNKLDEVNVEKLNKIEGATAFGKNKNTPPEKPKGDTATGSWMQYWMVVPKNYNWKMIDAKDSNGLALDVAQKDNITISYGTGNDIANVEYNVYVISHDAAYDTTGISWS